MGMKGISMMKKMRAVAVTGLVFACLMLVVLGCSSEKKEAPKAATETSAVEEKAKADVSTESVAKGSAMPKEHPAVDQMQDVITKASHANIKTQKEIELSDEVKAKWTEAQLEITDRAAQRTEVVTIKVGTTVQLTNEGHHLKMEVLVPDYAISGSKILTRSNEPKNPAVLVSLLEGDKTVTRGWVFRELPEFNSFNDTRFNLLLISPGVAKAAPAK